MHATWVSTRNLKFHCKAVQNAATLPHFSLLMLGNEVTVKVLQGHFGHCDPLLRVVTHGEAGALAGHCHHVPAKG